MLPGDSCICALLLALGGAVVPGAGSRAKRAARREEWPKHGAQRRYNVFVPRLKPRIRFMMLKESVSRRKHQSLVLTAPSRAPGAAGHQPCHQVARGLQAGTNGAPAPGRAGQERRMAREARACRPKTPTHPAYPALRSTCVSHGWPGQAARTRHMRTAVPRAPSNPEQPGSLIAKKGLFATKQLWVTPHDDKQCFPSGDYVLDAKASLEAGPRPRAVRPCGWWQRDRYSWGGAWSATAPPDGLAAVPCRAGLHGPGPVHQGGAPAQLQREITSAARDCLYLSTDSCGLRQRPRAGKRPRPHAPPMCLKTAPHLPPPTDPAVPACSDLNRTSRWWAQTPWSGEAGWGSLAGVPAATAHSRDAAQAPRENSRAQHPV